MQRRVREPRNPRRARHRGYSEPAARLRSSHEFPRVPTEWMTLPPEDVPNAGNRFDDGCPPAAGP